ncbi:MAG: hypothetical protein ACRCZO_04510 [Cetobacterium sp.]
MKGEPAERDNEWISGSVCVRVCDHKRETEREGKNQDHDKYNYTT